MDILIALYFHIKKKDDKIILSKGHAAPALYTVLAAKGLMTKKRLATFHENSTSLPVHVPHDLIKKEIPFGSGSLGHGLSLGCGIAHAKKYKKERGNIYIVMSDGECNEGQIWEAAQYAATHKLNNITVFVDVNNIQAFGKTEDVLGKITKEKWTAFGWDAYECDGHDIEVIVKANKQIKKSNKPKVILCNTIKGFGLSFFEHTIESHYLPLSEKQYIQGLKELQKL
jgi:transketolase